ncbi:MAG TPA: hypothetical protein VMJ66_06980 [Geobacteraceae bacterium]|nr:hypothetical protein [Geobacteraceae bacterium]
MITLEVDGQFVTWPEQFARYMMRYYQIHQMPFIVHINCIHVGWNMRVERHHATRKTERIGAFEYACVNR